MQPNFILTATACTIIFIASIPLSSLSQGKSLATRKYQPGEHYRYRLTTDIMHNEAWQLKTVAVCELTVVTDNNGIPYDEVHWISKKIYSAFDSIDQTKEALRVTPYRISLDLKGQLNLPPLVVASMTGEITDFNTFFVAVSPKMGITHLQKKGDVYTSKDLVKGDFANAQDILKGNDCLAVHTTLTNINKESIQVETSFLPPANPCLQFLTTDMNQAVAPDTLNNFQMVKPAGARRLNVLYGNEYFIVNSILQQKDGKIQLATMKNQLSLKIKMNCNDQYANCQSVMSFTMVRNLKLELLP